VRIQVDSSSLACHDSENDRCVESQIEGCEAVQRQRACLGCSDLDIRDGRDTPNKATFELRGKGKVENFSVPCRLNCGGE
jgi:hypothetical protein